VEKRPLAVWKAEMERGSAFAGEFLTLGTSKKYTQGETLLACAIAFASTLLEVASPKSHEEMRMALVAVMDVIEVLVRKGYAPDRAAINPGGGPSIDVKVIPLAINESDLDRLPDILRGLMGVANRSGGTPPSQMN
jgi:hypothetical protein